MIAITKNTEPVELTTYRNQTGATYDGANFTTVKNKIRKVLTMEQGYLCAYCMGRIKPDSNKMKVEHCLSQNPDNPSNTKIQIHSSDLAYSNMLGCCCGNEGNKPAGQHCDTSKGNNNLSFNPANPGDHNRLKIKYHGNGTIESDDPVIDEQINKMLNLNGLNNNPALGHRLKENRKKTWEGVTKALSTKPGTRTKEELNKHLRKFNKVNSAGELPEYCGVVRYYLGKKLKAQ
jgi:uncharacterized protein (TIGR02646 family)